MFLNKKMHKTNDRFGWTRLCKKFYIVAMYIFHLPFQQTVSKISSAMLTESIC